jgi:endoglucanase
MLELLMRLDAADGPSGDEAAVTALIAELLEGAYDERTSDALGSCVFTRRGPADAPRVLLCAHADELGFVIQHVEDEGVLRIAPVGFHDARMVVGQHVRVLGAKGPVPGVVGAAPFHVTTPAERERAIPLEDLFVDVGAGSREEAGEMGLHVGQLAVFARPGALLGGGRTYTGKAVDDRAGCAVLVETMRRLAGRPVPATIHAAVTVQEELGVRGAGPVGTVIQPDVALSIDVTICGDTPGTSFARTPIRMGEGPAITYWTFSPISGGGNAVPRRLTRRLEAAAEAAGVPYQREVLHGGTTDASPIARSGAGVLAGGIAVPSRYIHSAVGCVRLDDLEATVKLLVAFLEDAGRPFAEA